jgi:hypothetical protein
VLYSVKTHPLILEFGGYKSWADPQPDSKPFVFLLSPSVLVPTITMPSAPLPAGRGRAEQGVEKVEVFRGLPRRILLVLVFVLPSTAASTIHSEASQPVAAGNLPSTGQQTKCGPSDYGPLTQITGTLTPGEPADVFQIYINSGNAFEAVTVTGADPMLSMYTPESLGVMVNDDYNGLESRLAIDTPSSGAYYLAVHRYGGASIKDCMGANVFSGGISGNPGLNPVCTIESSGGSISYAINIVGDVTCTADLVPMPVSNLAYDTATYTISWDAYTGNAQSILVTLEPAGESLTVATTDTTLDIGALLRTGVNQITVQVRGTSYDSAQSNIGVTVVAPPSEPPTLAPTTVCVL